MKKLQKSFNDLLKLEIMSRNMYSEILRGGLDHNTAEKISLIRNQEVFHVRVAKNLIEISKKAERRKTKSGIRPGTLGYIRREIIFKKNLLETILRLITSKVESLALLSLLGRKSSKFKKMDQLRQELMGEVAHQLKTPLTATKWITEVLLKKEAGELTKNQKEMIGRIETTNKSMFALVDDLLEINRIESGKSPQDIKKIALVKLFQEITGTLDYLIKARQQQVFFRAFEARVIILSDENALRKIISNLLTNAINYGKIRGKIEIGIKRQGESSIVFSIADNGMGIPQKEQKKIFQKFYRTSGGQQAHPGGTGLGLYIVKELVKKLGGKIWFQSQENKGTAFFVSLPIK